MTKDRLDEIRARVEKATAGEWVNAGSDTTGISGDVGRWSIGENGYRKIATFHGMGVPFFPNPKQMAANMDFVAHSRQDIPDLLSYIDKLEAVIKIASTLKGWHTASCLLNRIPKGECDCHMQDMFEALTDLQE